MPNHLTRLKDLACSFRYVVILQMIVVFVLNYSPYISNERLIPQLQVSNYDENLKSACLESWNVLDGRWRRERNDRNTFLDSLTRNTTRLEEYLSTFKTNFDFWNPEFFCAKDVRVGNKYYDGGKWACDPAGLFGLEYALPSNKECIAYSIGSNFDLSFEEDLMNITKGNCKIYTFDPSLKNRSIGEEEFAKMALKSNVTFKPWGFSPISERRQDMGQFHPLSEMMKLLNHKHVDILKVDCEGCEYASMAPVFEACKYSSPAISMLLIELHIGAHLSFTNVMKFFEGADQCGLRIYHKEPNHWGCDGYRCVEYSLISSRLAFKSHIGTNCPKFLSTWEHLFDEISSSNKLH
jgi:hypothetical protein